MEIDFLAEEVEVEQEGKWKGVPGSGSSSSRCGLDCCMNRSCVRSQVRSSACNFENTFQVFPQ